jgi:hypothetical protein
LFEKLDVLDEASLGVLHEALRRNIFQFLIKKPNIQLFSNCKFFGYQRLNPKSSYRIHQQPISDFEINGFGSETLSCPASEIHRRKHNKGILITKKGTFSFFTASEPSGTSMERLKLFL